ncbi:MAG TPA: T9SS type A sorting domain-containing protein, partial [Ferruginibacter sp.]|nr:T9SS type A sorting domain-containing protein [Ferruginibacter sp.]
TKTVALTGKVLATEPTVQSTITIGAVTNSTVVVNFGGGNGTRRILLARLATPVNSDPVDGTTYTANANFGSGSQIGTGNYVVYDGIGNTQLVTGLTAGATYHFAIYDYNDGGVAGAENYLVPGGTGNATLATYSVPYVWVGLNGDWQVAANWAPPRLFPATNDSLLFTSASLNDIITNVPTQTVGYIGASLLTGTTLQAAANGNVLTIGNLAGPDFYVEAGSSFNINTANALTLNLVSGATASISGNMTYSAGPHKLTAADAGAITFNNGSSFTAGTGFSSNAFGVSPTAVANSVIFASGSTYRHISGGNPFALTQPASAVVFQTGSLFKLESILTPSVSGRTYANFELDAPSLSPISASGSGLLKMDNLTITNGSIAFSMTGGFELKGNVVVTSGDTLRFAPASAATLTLNGTTPQSISNSGTLTFGNNQKVNMNNAAGLTLNSPIALYDSLTFTAGIINTSAVNLLTMGSASSVTGASNASFVFGPVKKIGNTNFTFPVGKGNGYVPIGVSNFQASAATDEFTAEYIRSSAAALGPISDPLVKHVSGCDYWTLDLNNGTPTVDVTAYWNANNPCNGTYINNLATLALVHFNGTTWNSSSVGFNPPPNGTTAAGDITWTSVNTFSPFALGSSDIDNPLPIIINYFTGAKQGADHLLNWHATCAGTTGVTFSLERSTDGRNYASIYSTYATAVRCQQPFYYTDNQPSTGVNYYRLKMTDTNGKVTYSSIVSLINAVKGIDVMNISPNPIVNGAFNLKVSSAQKTNMEFVITDMQGRVMLKQSANIIAGFNQVPVSVKQLAAGTYQLFGNTSDGKTRTLRFVVQ